MFNSFLPQKTPNPVILDEDDEELAALKLILEAAAARTKENETLATKRKQDEEQQTRGHMDYIRRPRKLSVSGLTSQSSGLPLTSPPRTSSLKRPPSLSAMASPRGLPMTSSYASLSSALGSPIGRRSREGSISIFSREDDDNGLLIKSFAFEELEEEQLDDSFFRYSNRDVVNFADIMRVPKDFLMILRLLWRRHKILATWRLSDDPFEKSKRRYSLIIDDEVIYSSKQTNTGTQTGSVYLVCGGHIARDASFRDKKYRLLDNNFSGAFHKSVVDKPCDLELLENLHKNMSPDIVEAKIVFDKLVTFSEMVETCDKELKPTGKKLKHYIQEARTIFYVIDIIENCIGCSEFISATSREIIFRAPQNNLCTLDLTKLIPNAFWPYADVSFKDFNDFKAFIQDNDLEDHHAPVFNIITVDDQEVRIPVMVLAGKNGCPIAGDFDPENICERSDAPEIIYESFNGVKDEPIKFITGLSILVARLKCAASEEFCTYLGRLKLKLMLSQESSTLNAYADFFNINHSEEYTDYTQDEYYRDIYLPIAEATLELYIDHPELLLTVGESSIGGLVLQNDCDHELHQHDADNLNPSAVLAPIGMTFFYYEDEDCPNGRVCVTGNEESYIKFLLSDPKILKNNRVGVHPCRLGDATSGGEWANVWLDIIKIQALNTAATSPTKLKEYKRIIERDMKKRKSRSEEVAMEKIKNLFSSIYASLGNTNYIIDEEIMSIYAQYTDTSTKIKSKVLDKRNSQIIDLSRSSSLLFT